MFRVYALASLTAAVTLTAATAEAAWFRRRAQSTTYATGQTWSTPGTTCVCPPATDGVVLSTTLADGTVIPGTVVMGTTVMQTAGVVVTTTEAGTTTNATEAAPPAPVALTAEEKKWLNEMLGGEENKEYAESFKSATPAERKKVYEDWKKTSK